MSSAARDLRQGRGTAADHPVRRTEQLGSSTWCPPDGASDHRRGCLAPGLREALIAREDDSRGSTPDVPGGAPGAGDADGGRPGPPAGREHAGDASPPSRSRGRAPTRTTRPLEARQRRALVRRTTGREGRPGHGSRPVRGSRAVARARRARVRRSRGERADQATHRLLARTGTRDVTAPARRTSSRSRPASRRPVRHRPAGPLDRPFGRLALACRPATPSAAAAVSTQGEAWPRNCSSIARARSRG